MSRFRVVSDHLDGDPARAAEHQWRDAALLLGAWLAFALLETAVAGAVSRGNGEAWRDELRVNLAVALYWAAASLPIARYHRWLRGTRRAPALVVAAHIPSLALAALGATAVTRLAWRWLAGETLVLPFAATLTYYVDLQIVSYVAIVAMTELLGTHRALIERERVAARRESLLSRARLDFLEAQLQPHFLFNALGAVSELAYENPPAAARVLRALVDIIRGARPNGAAEVTVGEELTAIEPYLDIQRLRFADWLSIDFEVDAAALECLVPRFVLQPLVENAIRHGLTGRTAPGSISIAARLEQDALVLRVTDNGVGLKASRGTAGYGIGLTNLRERLALLYGNGDRLRLASEPGSGTVAELRLDRRVRARAAGGSDERTTLEMDQPDVVATRNATSPSARQRMLAIAMIWFGCGLLWSQQSFAYLAVRGRLGTASWGSVARNDMSSALIWLAITPLVFVATSRWPIRRPWIAGRIGLYALGAVILAVVHPLLLQRVTNPESPFWTLAYPGGVVVAFAIVVVLVAIGHRRQLADWLRTRELADAMLGAEVRSARARAERLHGVSPPLVRALERIAEIVQLEPRRTEELLARVADYLRVAIESSDELGVTPERERVLSYCVARVEESGGFVLQPHASA